MKYLFLLTKKKSPQDQLPWGNTPQSLWTRHTRYAVAIVKLLGPIFKQQTETTQFLCSLKTSEVKNKSPCFQTFFQTF